MTEKKLQIRIGPLSKELPSNFISSDERKIRLIFNHPETLSLAKKYEGIALQISRPLIWEGATQIAFVQLAEVLEALRRYDEGVEHASSE